MRLVCHLSVFDKKKMEKCLSNFGPNPYFLENLDPHIGNDMFLEIHNFVNFTWALLSLQKNYCV